MSQMTMTLAFNDMIACGGNLIAFEIFTNKVTLSRIVLKLYYSDDSQNEEDADNDELFYFISPLSGSFPYIYFISVSLHCKNGI